MDTGRPDELTLHAFMDGELAPAQAAEVAGWLADHPFEAARVAALQEQKSMLQALHADVLDAPVPLNLARAVRRPRTQWHWPHAVAAALMLAVGVGMGYGMGASQGLGLGTGLGDRTQGQGLAMTRNGGAPAPLPTFVRDAAAAHAVFAPEQRHPVEVAAQQQEHLVQWLSKRLGVKLTAPSLDAQGFRLMGGAPPAGRAGASPGAVHVRGRARRAPDSVRVPDDGHRQNRYGTRRLPVDRGRRHTWLLLDQWRPRLCAERKPAARATACGGRGDLQATPMSGAGWAACGYQPTMYQRGGAAGPRHSGVSAAWRR